MGKKSYQLFYDERGNPTSYLGATLAWAGKQLVSHSTGGSGGKAILTTFAYDENGLRTQKIYNSVTTTNYYYNGSVLMGMVTGTGTTAIHQLFSYDSSGNVVSVDYSTNGGSTFTTYYYVRNAQNDVVKLINGSGTTVVEYTYDTWGKLLSTTGSLASTLGVNQPFRYRGYVYDTETGWYYLQSRYYDPYIGRFISADVLLSTGQGVLGHNAFAYCLNNPVNSVDSTGTYGQDFSIWNETWTDDEIAGGERKPDKYYRPYLLNLPESEILFYIPVIGVCARGEFGWSVSFSAGISPCDDLNGVSVSGGAGTFGVSVGVFFMMVAVPDVNALEDCKCMTSGATIAVFGGDYVLFYDDEGNNYHGFIVSINIPIVGPTFEVHGEIS